MSWYGDGTLQVAANGTVATGTGTAFIGNVRIGDGITIAGSTALHEVTGVSSDTQLTFQPPYAGAAGSGKVYRIAPVLGYDKDLSDAFNQIRLQWGTQLGGLQPWSYAPTAAAARDQLGMGGLLNPYCVVSGSPNAIALTVPAPWSTPAAYGPGAQFRFRAAATNTGASTINVAGLGAKAARTVTGAALPAGYIRTDVDTQITYDAAADAFVVDREVESGSNANGSFFRYADGRLDCLSGIITGTVSVTTAVPGGGFRGTQPAWTYPAPFSGLPNVSPLSRTNNHLIGALISLSTTLVAPAAFALASNAALSCGYQASATGRWYG